MQALQLLCLDETRCGDVALLMACAVTRTLTQTLTLTLTLTLNLTLTLSRWARRYRACTWRAAPASPTRGCRCPPGGAAWPSSISHHLSPHLPTSPHISQVLGRRSGVTELNLSGCEQVGDETCNPTRHMLQPNAPHAATPRARGCLPVCTGGRRGGQLPGAALPPQAARPGRRAAGEPARTACTAGAAELRARVRVRVSLEDSRAIGAALG